MRVASMSTFFLRHIPVPATPYFSSHSLLCKPLARPRKIQYIHTYFPSSLLRRRRYPLLISWPSDEASSSPCASRGPFLELRSSLNIFIAFPFVELGLSTLFLPLLYFPSIPWNIFRLCAPRDTYFLRVVSRSARRKDYSNFRIPVLYLYIPSIHTAYS